MQMGTLIFSYRSQLGTPIGAHTFQNHPLIKTSPEKNCFHDLLSEKAFIALSKKQNRAFK